MPSKRGGSDLVVFSSQDPGPLVKWLCDTYGLQTVLQSVAQYQPSSESAEAPTKRAYKKRSPKKGSKKGAKKGGGKRGRKSTKGSNGRKATSGGTEVGNG